MSNEVTTHRHPDPWIVTWGLIIVIFVVALTGGLVMLLSAAKKPAKARMEARFKWESPPDGYRGVCIVKDVKTNVEYLVVYRNNAVGITPLLPRQVDPTLENW